MFQCNYHLKFLDLEGLVNRLGKLPSKEQQLSRTQHFILKAHAAIIVLHIQYGPRNIADPYDTTTELSPINSLPLFYRNILTVWQILHSKVPLSVNEIKEKILWNNRFIKIGGKTVFYKAWLSKGILRIKDILYAHDNFLSFQDLKDTFDIRGTFLDYGGLLAAIPND